MKKLITLALGGLSIASLVSLGLFLNKENPKEAVESFTEKGYIANDIFGVGIGEVELNKKETKLCSLENTLVKPKIGFQKAYSNGGNNISIRYTALISSLDVTATWTRGLFDSNGDEASELPYGEYSVTKAYEGITNGGDITYAKDIEDEDGNHPYKYFVVYTLLDIPLNTYGTYYLDAYLTIDDNTNSMSTKVGALEVNQEDFFTYDLASPYLSFDSNTDTKEFTLLFAGPEYVGEVDVPAYYNDGDHRYPVTAIGAGAFLNRTSISKINLPNTITKIGDYAFDGVEMEALVLPNSIQTIGMNFITSNSDIDYICYNGSKSDFNKVEVNFENATFNSNILYFYDEDLDYCDSFKFDGSDVVISTKAHIEGTPVEENITATCLEAGTVDLVAYCERCGLELERKTIAKAALGHDYLEKTGTNDLGHSFTSHSCDRCGDYYTTDLAVDYTKTYSYQEFQTNSYYAAYKEDIASIYLDLYEGCMEILNSTEDYTPTGGKYMIAKAHYSSSLNSDQAWGIANYFVDCHPEFYFVSNSIWRGTDSNGNYVGIALNPDYYTYQARGEVNDGIRAVEEDFTREFYSDGTLIDDISKAKFIHDYIANNLYYQYEADGKTPSGEDWAHSIVGFMDLDPNTGGVCECYAKVYVYLCNLVGIKSIIISGYGNGGGHAWNYTKINGSWYGIDITWDDQQDSNNIGRVYYTFFLASKSTMETGKYPFSNSTHEPASDDFGAYQVPDYLNVILPELESESCYNG